MHGPKRKEVAIGWKGLQYEELHNVYTLPSIITVIKSGSMRRTEHVARIGDIRNI